MGNLINLIQASLLHHIELFRGSNLSELKWKKPEISPEEEEIIKRACSLARGKEPGKEAEILPGLGLEPIFQRVSSEKEPKARPRYYQAAKLTESYPALQDEKPKEEEYRVLWDEFAKEFNQQVAGNLHPENLLLLLEKYTSLLPFDAANPDVSLFNHLKMTTAIASCLYLSSGSSISEKFLLVGGDFSGVQDFVYTITSKGALRTLKARSFFLELFAEHIIYEILHPLGLSRTNIISSGGGRFYLLLPNVGDIRNLLKELKSRINGYLRNEHEARLYFVFVWQGFSQAVFLDKEKLSSLWQGISQKIREEKRRKFKDSLEDLFAVEPHKAGKLTECQICHKEISQRSIFSLPGKVHACEFCHSLYHLGEELFQAKFILRGVNKTNQSTLKIEEKYYHTPSKLPPGHSGPKWVINSWDLKDYKEKDTYPFLLGNYQIRSFTFQDYARVSQGAKRIAALRMDVDSLGNVFSQGFGDKQSLLRTSILSSQLNLFFGYYLNALCKDKNVAIVYAGGDDLFIIGAWNDIIELGFDIHSAFEKYTLGKLTLSGGFVVLPPNFPLYQMAYLAGKAEERAKDNQEGGKKKDSLTLFYNSNPEKLRREEEKTKLSFNWKGAEELRELKKEMAGFLGEEKSNYLQLKVSRSFIYNLLTITDYWRREGKLYLPKLAYVLTRAESELKRRFSQEWGSKKGKWEKLKSKLMKFETVINLYPLLTWIELLSRKEE